MKRKREIIIQLIPVYIPDAEFQEKKKEIQNLIARMIVSVHEENSRKKTNRSSVRASHGENDYASLSKNFERKII